MTAQTFPHVVVHAAVSLDGATGGFEPDVAAFYELAHAFNEDVTLVGADTILAQEEALAGAPRPGPTEGAPLLAVVDGRERVSEWEALRDFSLLVHPCLAGNGSSPWHGPSAPPAADLEPIANERVADELVWLRYRIADGPSPAQRQFTPPGQ